MASRSRPTNHRMFRDRARSSKWFVRSCSRFVLWQHWLWSQAMHRLQSAARLAHRSARRQSQPSAVQQLLAALLLAVPLLAVLADPLRAVQLLLAAAVQPLLLQLQLLQTHQSLPQLKRSSQPNLLAGSVTACDSHESRAVFHLSPLRFPENHGAAEAGRFTAHPLLRKRVTRRTRSFE